MKFNLSVLLGVVALVVAVHFGSKQLGQEYDASLGCRTRCMATETLLPQHTLS